MACAVARGNVDLLKLERQGIAAVLQCYGEHQSLPVRGGLWPIDEGDAAVVRREGGVDGAGLCAHILEFRTFKSRVPCCRVYGDNVLAGRCVLNNGDAQAFLEGILSHFLRRIGQTGHARNTEVIEPEFLAPNGELVDVANQGDGAFKCKSTDHRTGDLHLHAAHSDAIENGQSTIAVGAGQGRGAVDPDVLESAFVAECDAHRVGHGHNGLDVELGRDVVGLYDHAGAPATVVGIHSHVFVVR